MKMSTREIGKITVLEPKGKITIGSGDVLLRDTINETVSSGAKNLLVDLKGVSKMDSSGLGELVAAHNTVSANGGSIKLVNIPSKIFSIFGVAQIISVMDVFDDIDEAVGSFDRS